MNTASKLKFTFWVVLNTERQIKFNEANQKKIE